MNHDQSGWDYTAPIGGVYGPMAAKTVTAYANRRLGGKRVVVTAIRGSGATFKISGVGETDEGFVEACLRQWGMMP